MVNPPEPPSPRKPILDFDEWVAIIVAFGAIAAILFWGITRKTHLFTFNSDFAAKSVEEKALDKALSNVKKETKAKDRKTSQEKNSDREAQAKDSKSLVSLLVPSLAEQEPVTLPPPPTVELSPASPQPSPAETPEVSTPFAPAQPETSPSTPDASSSPDASSPQASPTDEPKKEFSDVPEDYWASGAIATLVEKEIVSGFPDGTFAPDRPTTRAEFAAQLQKIFDREASTNAIAFSDVESDYWGASGIESAVKMGFMKGYPGEIFKPEDRITRLQVLLSLTSGLELEPSETPEETLEIYRDASEIPDWAAGAIAAATDAGLVVNYPDLKTFNPNEPATRADVAVMIYQALARSGQVDQLESEYLVPVRE